MYLGFLFLLVTFVSCEGARRIFGGEYVRQGELPYQVAVAIRIHDAKNVMCGGAIIDRYHVVTAGHCLELGAMYVKGGNVIATTGAWHKVISYVTPYVNLTFSRDIALLHVTPPFDFDNLVKPVRLPSPNDVISPGTDVQMSGWGLVDKRQASEKLKKVSLNVVDEEECRKTWVSLQNDYRLCAKGKSPEGTCAGDSGGPLVRKVNGEFILIGVLSYGTDDCSLGLPEVYTNVRMYVPWIKRQTAKMTQRYRSLHRRIIQENREGKFMTRQRKEKTILKPGYKVLKPSKTNVDIVRPFKHKRVKREAFENDDGWNNDDINEDYINVSAEKLDSAQVYRRLRKLYNIEDCTDEDESSEKGCEKVSPKKLSWKQVPYQDVLQNSANMQKNDVTSLPTPWKDSVIDITASTSEPFTTETMKIRRKNKVEETTLSGVTEKTTTPLDLFVGVKGHSRYAEITTKAPGFIARATRNFWKFLQPVENVGMKENMPKFKGTTIEEPYEFEEVSRANTPGLAERLRNALYGLGSPKETDISAAPELNDKYPLLPYGPEEEAVNPDEGPLNMPEGPPGTYPNRKYYALQLGRG